MRILHHLSLVLHRRRSVVMHICRVGLQARMHVQSRWHWQIWPIHLHWRHPRLASRNYTLVRSSRKNGRIFMNLMNCHFRVWWLFWLTWNWPTVACIGHKLIIVLTGSLICIALSIFSSWRTVVHLWWQVTFPHWWHLSWWETILSMFICTLLSTGWNITRLMHHRNRRLSHRFIL